MWPNGLDLVKLMKVLSQVRIPMPLTFQTFILNFVAIRTRTPITCKAALALQVKREKGKEGNECLTG